MTDSVLPRSARIAGRVFAWVLAALLVATVIAAAWVGIRGVLAYGHLRDAQASATDVRASLSDPAAAATAIDALSEDTGAARALTSDPIWSLAAGLPWVGPQLAAVSAVAASLDDVAGTALTPLSEVASTFQVDALRPQGGRIDVDTFAQLSPAAASAAEGVASAESSISAVDDAALLSPVRDAVDEVDQLLTEAGAATEALANATALLPAMLGAEGPRDYLVLFQNNAEWRSLGGIPGAMALIHTDGGTISLAAQESSSDFPEYPESVLPLGDEIEAIYGQRPGKWIQNVTQVPDFTVSGSLAREMWARQHGGQQVDGVIALDPVALSYILEATGPVALPGGDTLTSENAVPLLLNEVYQRYQRPADQDAFFAAAAAAVFEALAAGDVDPAKFVTALGRAGDENRLLLWSAHEDDQALLNDTTLSGPLPVTDDDTARFGVYVDDGTGSKMSFYQTLTTDVAWTECTVDAAGDAGGTATVTATIANNAPADAASLPSYITGGGRYGVAPGTTRTVGYVYIPEGWELADAQLSTGGGFGGGVHDGRRVVSFTVDLGPGQSASAVVTAHPVVPGAAVIDAVETPTLTPPTAIAATCGAPLQ
ncbi:DUF4012 domain-containing protein [Microbacterium kyungheense]|uniref:Uncharacterized protein DUF4012 n=1 Tax=Microbacterium kyungheense TaxID=1263636 RepID=A0A543FK49_9MICO|nr:DUF4012 domain-containing protein [Microbacterium kyungheense]TQM34086.1 uncharacterized protein DUF4012 [Microbacterium kyungheense]